MPPLYQTAPPLSEHKEYTEQLQPTQAQLRKKQLIRPGFIGTFYISLPSTTPTATSPSKYRGFVGKYKAYPGFIEFSTCFELRVQRVHLDINRSQGRIQVSRRPKVIKYGRTYEENPHTKTHRIFTTTTRANPNSNPNSPIIISLSPFQQRTLLDKRVLNIYDSIKHYNIMPDVFTEDFNEPI